MEKRRSKLVMGNVEKQCRSLKRKEKKGKEQKKRRNEGEGKKSKAKRLSQHKGKKSPVLSKCVEHHSCCK